MVDPITAVGGGAVLAAIVGSGYLYQRSRGNLEDGAPESGETEDVEPVDSTPLQGPTPPTNDVGGDEEDESPNVDIDAEDLVDVKGIAETRAETLRENDFETPKDLYFATDENIEAVDGFGPHVVRQIREDIGSVDEEIIDD